MTPFSSGLTDDMIVKMIIILFYTVWELHPIFQGPLNPLKFKSKFQCSGASLNHLILDVTWTDTC